MTTARCPKCHDPVTLPAGASPQASVRCPLCQEQFPLAEILADLPPALVIVEDPGAQAVRSGGSYFGFSPAPAGADAALLAGPAFSLAQPSASAGTASAAPRRRKVAARPQRKPKNAVMEVIKVALGGIAGLAIAQLALWWVPLPWRVDRDPVGLAQPISKVAPWIVPQELHGSSNTNGKKPTEPTVAGASAIGSGELPVTSFIDPNQPNAGAENQPAKPAGSTKKSARTSSKKPATKPRQEGLPNEDGLGELPSEDPPSDTPTGLGGDLMGLDDLEGLAKQADGLDTDPVSAEPSHPAKAPEPVAPEETPEPWGSPSTPGREDTLQPPAPPAAEATRLQDVPRRSGAEVNTALNEAETAAQAWMTAASSDTRDLLGSTYRALAKASESISLADTPQREHGPRVEQLMVSLAEDSQKLAMLGKAGALWLRSGKRDSAGVMLIGDVQEISQHGELYETRLALNAEDPPALIYVDQDPRDLYRVKDRLCVSGVLVEAPQKRVRGYQGDAHVLVWGQVIHVLAD